MTKTLSMISYKSYSPNVDEGFVIFSTSKLISCLIDNFTSKMKSQLLAYLLNGSEHIYIYILDFGPWKWSALNMDYMDKRPSKMQGLGHAWGMLGSGAEALALLVLPLPATLTIATLMEGV